MKEYIININGNEYKVAVNSVVGNKADVTVNGASYQAQLSETESEGVQRTMVATPKKTPVVAAPAQKPASVQNGGKKAVKAPLPGVIVSVNVKVGDTVKAGQVVAVLEAMKMENDILSEVSGTVTTIHVAAGDSVLEATTLLTIV